MSRKTWVEMVDGQILTAIPFVAWVRFPDGRERQLEFLVGNPPIRHGDSNLFTRLLFEHVREVFAEKGLGEVHHIIRGESSEAGCKDCYVYNARSEIPFAVIRPKVFVR